MTDVLVYLQQARDDSPDYFVAGTDLAAPRQVSLPRTRSRRTTPGRAPNSSTSRASRDGPLQAALLYPADYDASRRSYPMIVYTYELLAPQIHNVPGAR